MGFLKIRNVLYLDEKRVEITRFSEGGVLYYGKLSLCKDPSGDRQWKRVIKSKEEQERIMKACHASPHAQLRGFEGYVFG